MRKVALVFILAVIVPSLLLAWLAVRSLRDQQFLLERQASLLGQRSTDAVAQKISEQLAQQQREFAAQVETLIGDSDAKKFAAKFDDQIRQRWPLAEVGFCVTRSGKLLAPSPTARTEAQAFCLDNSGFLANRQPVEVYWNISSVNAANNSSANSVIENALSKTPPHRQPMTLASESAGILAGKMSPDVVANQAGDTSSSGQNSANFKAGQLRKVSPQSQAYQSADQSKTAAFATESQNNWSRVVPAEAEFAQLVGKDTDGMLARFLQNKLKLMFWHRLNRDPDFIFGAQLDLNLLLKNLRQLVQPEPDLSNEICLALLDDNAKPVVVSRPNFSTNWKRPFVATEIGDALPHWEVAAYLVDPAAPTRTACNLNLTLGLLIAVLVLAIVIGSWLIVRSLRAELTLARQKTDFVSNVSHELKTPLTSIHMFSELLAEGRVTDPVKQHAYLKIITAEAARLTRLINNVLDFSRLESGEKKYNFQPCDLGAIVRATADIFRPPLAANHFKFDCELPATPVFSRGDVDALSQIIVNLLSNAEKYSNAERAAAPPPLGGVKGGDETKTIHGSERKKEITLQLTYKQAPLPHAEIKVLDRGPGVPRGSEEKIFEKFYRAHDSLASGIQGSGLGLTIARQIARAHGGDVVYELREGGGSCFVLRLPLKA